MKRVDLMTPCVVSLLLILTGISYAQSETGDPANDAGRWQQNYLFMLKDAYLLAPGETRVSVEGSYWQNRQYREIEAGSTKRVDRDQFMGVLALERGLIPGLQADISLPFGYAKNYSETTDTILEKGGIGDLRGGLALELAQQDHTSWLPTVSTRLGAIAQLADWERGFDKGAWGWEGSLLASKAFDDFFWHGNITYRSLANTREFGQTGKADESDWIFGFGLVYSPKQGYEVMCETTYETLKETTKIETEHRHAWYITPGMNIDLSPNMQLGVGIPIGAGDEAYDWAFLMKLQIKM